MRLIITILLALMVALGLQSGAAGHTRLTSDECMVLSLLNQERKDAKLAPLVVDPVLVRAAREHSQEMAAQKYFDHISPTPGKESPVRRWIAELGYLPYGWALIGENLAWCSKLKITRVHEDLMKSATHRSNILEPRYERIGIGVYVDTNGELWLTQMFLSVWEREYKSEQTRWGSGWWTRPKHESSLVRMASAK